MKTYIYFFVLSFFFMSILTESTFAQNIQSLSLQARRKIDPMLTQAIVLKEKSPKMKISSIESYTAGKRLQVSAGEVVSVLIEASSDIKYYIRSIGGVVGSKHGNIYTATIPISAVTQVAQHSAVSYIEVSRKMHASLDLSRAKTDADVLHIIPGEEKLTGKGVILGFTDTGINTDHPAFKLPDGRTRILYVWDQWGRSVGTPPAGYDYGIEKDSSDINAHLWSMSDGWQHGTHVSGIAAGNGGGTQYIGMAPEADIIMVSCRYDDLDNLGATTVGVLDGYAYIREKANALGKRYVINTSLGVDLGPHDGTTLFERALDAEVGNGSIICVAAGNEADIPWHASTIVTTSSSEIIRSNVNWCGGETFYMDIWYKCNDRIDLKFYGPGGTPTIIPSADTTVTATYDGWVLSATSRIGSPLNGDNEVIISIQIFSDDSEQEVGVECYAAEGTTLPDGGRIDLWWEPRYPTVFADHVDPSITIDMPGSADSAITVGSYNNRDDLYWGMEEAISTFSSLGPRRDGAMKPVIAGPGGSIISSVGSSGYTEFSGTSMASPHVAGAIALLLQQDPTLTNYQVKQKLITSAVEDEFTGSVPNNTWGYGKMNVLKAAGFVGVPFIGVLKDTIQFKHASLGFTKYDSVIIKNICYDVPLTISSISVDNPIFSIDKTSMVIPPTLEGKLIIGVTSTAVGNFSGMITVSSDDPNNPVSTVVLIGDCDYPPAIDISPTSYDLSIVIGNDTTSTLSINNTGAGPLYWENNNASNPLWITLSTSSGMVAPGATEDITVMFNTKNLAVGDYSANISITSNDPLRSQNNIPVTLHVDKKRITIHVNEKWNMVSIPLEIPDLSVSTVFPTVSGGIVYWYEQTIRSYFTCETLEYGKGYWANFHEVQDIVLEGNPIDSITIGIEPSWNMVGGISFPIATSDIIVDPPVYVTWFHYRNGGYYVPDTIKPGMGCWLKSNPPTSCTVKIKKGTSLPKGTTLSSQGRNCLSVSGFDKFTITDGSGNQQILYVANLDQDPVLAQYNLTMPPAFEEAKFDARFETGEMIKALSANTQTELGIAVKSEASTVNLSWELQPENGFRYGIITEKRQEANEISITGSMSVTIPPDGKIRLRAKGSGKGINSNVPTEYALHQNYPNPFNPVTTIKYQLPGRAEVKLEVFNILGQRVAMLVNADQEAGYYQVPFDAKALSSGIYFYRINAGSYVKSQKMLLLR